MEASQALSVTHLVVDRSKIILTDVGAHFNPVVGPLTLRLPLAKLKRRPMAQHVPPVNWLHHHRVLPKQGGHWEQTHVLGISWENLFICLSMGGN